MHKLTANIAFMFADRPFLDRIDGHISIANTAALKTAGITGKTQVPEGGAIDLDASGEPTGILRESAQELVTKIIPPPTHEERRRGDELAIADAVAHLKRCDVAIEAGPMQRFGAKGPGTSVYFRDPDGSLMEFMSYAGNG